MSFVPDETTMDVDVDAAYPYLLQGGGVSSAPRNTTRVNLDKNTHLKGRRRYNADLGDLKEECGVGLEQLGYIIKGLRAGDDEGSIELTIYSSQGQQIMSLGLLISDTSDYPRSHSFFVYSPDSDIPSPTFHAVESIVSGPSRPIRETLQRILASLGGLDDSSSHLGFQPQDVEDEGNDDTYEGIDELDNELSNVSAMSLPRLDPQKLQNDFIETIATGYRPGIIHFGDDDFAVSISLPIVTLANSIPPRALMAWDRRLLSQSQHLTLLISGFRGTYPPIDVGGNYVAVSQPSGTALRFKVGLTKRYKPGKEYAKDAGRMFGLIARDPEDELRIQAEEAASLESTEYEFEETYMGPGQSHPTPLEEEEVEDGGRFDRFSLSSSLESLLDQGLLKVIQLRRQFDLGWAGAEVLFSEMEKSQKKPEVIFDTKKYEILSADQEERKLSQTNDLPHDPLSVLAGQDSVNIILTAFCYLVRRLMLCTRYCIVCYNKLPNDFEALKPYVCGSKLCTYQYYSFNRGPSLEYEIVHNPQTVDLLVSLAHSAATDQVLDEPLPIGLGLRVPLPDSSQIREPPTNTYGYAQAAVSAPKPSLLDLIAVGSDGLCDFDDLSLPMMRLSIVKMIDSLPAVDDMKKHLERKVKAGRTKPKLKDLDPSIIPAAWLILRWCVASCTAYLEEITSGEERIKNIDPSWRQFRFSVGAPDAEAKFETAINNAQNQNTNARSFPALYAFHGSAMRNWHSIIRHGLWYKSIANGRAYGNGVYLAKEGSVSMGHYAQPGRSTWPKSKISPTSCMALAEVVNLPGQFVSHTPYFVIKDTHWIMCRYLLVKGVVETYNENDVGREASPSPKKAIPMVQLDPAHPITLSAKHIEIPEPSHQINAMLLARREEFREEDNDPEDLAVFELQAPHPSSQAVANSVDGDDFMDDEDVNYDDDDDNYEVSTSKVAAMKGQEKFRPLNDWKHDSDWVTRHVENLMPPPVEATPGATMAVQRELKAMLKDQERATSLKDLGWHIPPDLIGDNLFQWIVEMHSFDEDLPIAKDMKSRNLNSIIFEIRFPPSFPLAPPFFRIVTPRFLPFIHGGGGHVTSGGSICMDLLTADGWLPSYSISAVLMQIKLAISSLDPRPARLGADFDRPYNMHEALVGYKRAAATHGWRLPVGIEYLSR